MKKKRNKNYDCQESNKNNKNKKNDDNNNDRNNDSGDLIERKKKKKKKTKRIENRKIGITQHFDISYLAMLLIKLILYYINTKVPTCPRAS